MIPLSSVQEDDYYLSYHRDQQVGWISGFFCTNQYVEIRMMKKGIFDVEVDMVSFSSCNDRSVIHNMIKKEARAFKNFPVCRN